MRLVPPSMLLRLLVLPLVAFAVLAATVSLPSAVSAQTPTTTPAPSPAPAPGFADEPVYGANGIAFAVFEGGSIDELSAAATAAGASGVWVQDETGDYRLLVLGGPAFVLAVFESAFTDGFPQQTAVTLIRQQRLVLSPVDRAEIAVSFSEPPVYALRATFGLPNGCHQFHGVEIVREGARITVTAHNTVHDAGACTQVYGFVEQKIDLGSDFVSGRVYTVRVNDVTRTFLTH